MVGDGSPQSQRSMTHTPVMNRRPDAEISSNGSEIDATPATNPKPMLVMSRLAVVTDEVPRTVRRPTLARPRFPTKIVE